MHFPPIEAKSPSFVEYTFQVPSSESSSEQLSSEELQQTIAKAKSLYDRICKASTSMHEDREAYEKSVNSEKNSNNLTRFSFSMSMAKRAMEQDVLLSEYKRFKGSISLRNSMQNNPENKELSTLIQNCTHEFEVLDKRITESLNLQAKKMEEDLKVLSQATSDSEGRRAVPISLEDQKQESRCVFM